MVLFVILFSTPNKPFYYCHFYPVAKTVHFLYAKCNFFIFVLFFEYNLTWRFSFYTFLWKEAPESRNVWVLLAKFVICGAFVQVFFHIRLTYHDKMR